MKEPIEMKAGDERVLVNGLPLPVDYRIVWEENYKELKRAFDLASVNKSLLIDVLKRYEQWEANLIMEDSCWEGGMPTLTNGLYEELLEIQKLRNEALSNEQLVCPECKSTDCKAAIHTDYKECNKCYHYWEVN